MGLLTLFLSGLLASSSYGNDSDRRAQEEDSRRASEIRSAAASLRDRAQSVRAKASAARSEASSIRNRAASLDQERSSAHSRRMSMANEISQLNAEASRLVSEAAKLRRETEAFREQKAQVDVQIAKNSETLSALLKIVYNLEARVSFHEKENSDLQAVQEHVHSIQNNLDHLKILQTKAATSLNLCANSHAEWMKEIDELTDQLAPKFKDLKDSNSVAKASSAISAFEKMAPSPTRPNSAEDVSITQQKEIGALSIKIQEQLRALGSMPGIAVYHKYLKTEFDSSFWKNMDESIHQNANLAAQVETLLKLFRERRVYLVRIIPLMWERMLNVRLDSIHLEKSVRTGQIAMDGLSLPDLVAKSADLDKLHNSAVRLFVEYHSPLLASDQIESALEFAEQLVQRLNQLQSSNANEPVRVAIQTRRSRLDSLRKQVADAAQSKLDENLNKRREFIAAQTSPGKSLSPSCRSIKQEVLSTPANRANENAFVHFIESCL